MPNIAVMLKNEILRLARKEVRKEIESLKKTTALHRAEIAALKRRLAAAEKQGSRSPRKASGPMVEIDADGGSKIRFSAGRLAKHREKLGLSASDYGKLLGVAAQTIYNWEAGKSRPRQAQLQAIASIRKIGKRQIKTKLADAAEPEE